MAFTNSPLRYPGGKSALARTLRDIIVANDLRFCTYAEPFAGGCGLALRLLFDGVVARLSLNDLDPAIWAFWFSTLNHTEELASRIEAANVSVEAWHQHRAVLLEGSTDDIVSLGFAAFFLNRTNRSGIIKSGGIIGGLDQRGKYKIDCRFNRSELAGRVRRIGLYRERIELTRLDAVDFLNHFEEGGTESTLLCIDPPYFNKGSSLYSNFYRKEDHATLAQRVLRLTCPWIMTYDDAPQIQALYKDCPAYRFSINYSAQQKRVGTELMVHSAGLKIPYHIQRTMRAA